MWIDEEQNKTNLNGQPANNLSVGAGGGSSASGGQTSTGISGNPSTINPVQANQPQQKFATVQDYLGANKQQGEDLGQKVTSGLSESVNKEKADIDTVTAGAQNDITAGTTNYDPNFVSKTLENPTAVVNDPNQLSSFLKQWNASYSGPQSFETTNQYNQAAKAANDAATNAAEVGSTGGRQQLIQDKFNVYGQGNKGLDETLLQQSSYFPQVQEQGKQFSSIPDYLKANATTVNASVPVAQQQSANTRTQFQNALDTGTAAAQAKSAASEQASKQAALVNPASSDLQFLSTLPQNPSDIDLFQRGINRDQYNGLVKSAIQSGNPNFTPSEGLSNPAYGLPSTTHPQDLANYLALKQLTSNQR